MKGYHKAEIDPQGLKLLLEGIKNGKLSRQPSNYAIMTTLHDAGIAIEYGPAGTYRKAIKDNLWTIK